MPQQMPPRATVSFRVIHDHDRAFLQRVYDSTRETEFAVTTWSEPERRRFLDGQFRLQDTGYRTAHPGAIHRIIQLDGTDIGRLIVDRQDDCLRIIDLSILPGWRGRGIGSDILRGLLHEAQGGKVPARLHAVEGSRAQAMYLRLGFRPTHRNGHYIAMEWQPDLRPREL